MQIRNPEMAAEFISRYGNVSLNPKELLAEKPSESQLADAKRRCMAEVDLAFAFISDHHEVKKADGLLP